MDTVFISGSRSIKELDENVQSAIHAEIKAGSKIIVGDADGVDCSVQTFCVANNYSNAAVYTSNGKARNNVDGFAVKAAAVASGTNGRDFFTQKDIGFSCRGLIGWYKSR